MREFGVRPSQSAGLTLTLTLEMANSEEMLARGQKLQADANAIARQSRKIRLAVFQEATFHDGSSS